jgi:ubiquinone biosynthesis protein
MAWNQKMNQTHSRLFKFLFNNYLQNQARINWIEIPEIGLVSEKEIQTWLHGAWGFYFPLTNELPRFGNIGNWLVMNFAALSIATFQSLTNHGIDEIIATKMIGSITWRITSKWSSRAQRFTKLLFRDQLDQLKFFVNGVMKTLFRSPGYQFDFVDHENGFLLNVRRCPVADLMKAKGVSDLCVQTWCGVDFGLVDIFGSELVREGTIASGKIFCDFNFLGDLND